jgi:hypothetical protein
MIFSAKNISYLAAADCCPVPVPAGKSLRISECVFSIYSLVKAANGACCVWGKLRRPAKALLFFAKNKDCSLTRSSGKHPLLLEDIIARKPIRNGRFAEII